MEMAITILAWGFIDAVITDILSETKNQKKVKWLRVSIGLIVAVTVGAEIWHLLDFARGVFRV